MTHDVFAPEKRATIMRAVKSGDTKPERQVRRALHAAGFRFRLHRADLAGKPDIVLPRYKAVVFVHGCFWHGHDCKRGARTPKTNAAYWRAKIARNTDRDAAAVKALSAQGWRVFIVWECELRAGEKTMTALAAAIRSDKA
ncbi:MAG: very short patch repair endonuclease [Pseudomonadota bacterium]